MPKLQLTQQFVDNPPIVQHKPKTDYFDTRLTGFFLEVRATGKATYYQRYRDKHRKNRQTRIGPADAMNEFITIFPVENRYDGGRHGVENRFSTMKYLRKIGMDTVIASGYSTAVPSSHVVWWHRSGLGIWEAFHRKLQVRGLARFACDRMSAVGLEDSPKLINVEDCLDRVSSFPGIIFSSTHRNISYHRLYASATLKTHTP